MSEVTDTRPFQHVELADGTILDASAAEDLSGSLWVWTNGESNMMDTFLLFNNPEATAKIICRIGGSEQEWNGYTKMIGISQDIRGSMHIRMTKEERTGEDNASD